MINKKMSVEDVKLSSFITSNPKNTVFRKSFTIDNADRAVLFISGLGYYDLFVNGRRVTDNYFLPAVSSWHECDFNDMLYPFKDKMSFSTYYNCYDVASMLKSGCNSIAVALGNGFYNQTLRVAEGKMEFGTPKLMCLLKYFENGKEKRIVTDESWKCAPWALTGNNLFYGERYDSRLLENWYAPELCDDSWDNAVLATDKDTVMRLQLCPPDSVSAVISPEFLGKSFDRYIYDAGENLTGVVKIRGDFGNGEEIILRFSEEFNADGGLDFVSAGYDTQIQQDIYTGNGNQNQEYAPRFCWHGFRYFDSNRPLDNAEVLKIHADIKENGGFYCSDKRLNTIIDAFKNSLLSNMHGGVISDCPHRERLGYTGDGWISLHSAMLLYDAKSFYEKWLRDIADSQCTVSGHVQHTAPFFGGGGGPGGWGCAIVYVPYELYLMTADSSILEEYYENMDNWMKYLFSRSEDFIITHEEEGGWCLGDWGFPFKEKNPTEAFVNSCFYGRCALILKEISQILNRQKKSEEYENLAKNIQASVLKKFYNNESGLFDNTPQGSVFASLLEISTPESTSVMINHYKENPWFDTGIFATPFLLDLIGKSGENALAFDMLCSEKGPSYAYLFDGKNTTMREFWDGTDSHNHHMFGSVVSFIMGSLLGIPKDYNSEKIVLTPYIPEDMKFAKGHIQTPEGRLSLAWEKREENIVFDIDTPCSDKYILSVNNRLFPLKSGLNNIKTYS